MERRDILNSRDLSRLARLLAEHPELATTKMEHWCDHKSAGPVGYLAMLRFDHARLGLPSELPGTGAAAKALIDAGAPVDGYPGDFETPLITAASYGDAEVAKVLIDAAGDITGWPLARFTHQSRIRALVFAADHQRLDVIDQLIEAGTPVNEADAEWERLPLHTAAGNGRTASVRRLLTHGADPNLRDPRHHRTPLQECQPARSPGHREVEAILGPLTQNGAMQSPQTL